jgi:hypothetical protein
VVREAVSLAAAALALLAAIPVASAGADRFALVVGANDGLPSEVVLRYAEKDAERLARVLERVGGFAPSDVVVLRGPTAGSVRRELIEMNARVRQRARPALLFVYYSGHADAEWLHLGGSRLAVSELRALVTGSAAATRVLVVDACRSGALTRVKGGRAVPAFKVTLDPPEAEGTAILSSSAAGEDSQESDELGASIFTHHLVSALLGAGDRNRDGAVSLAEAFGYTADRTLAATAGTLVGPQHPTYHLELGGRRDLVLTRPGLRARGMGRLELAEPGSWLVQKEDRDGEVVAEVSAAAPGVRLAVEPGRYLVTRRADDHLLEGMVAVASDEVRVIGRSRMRRVDYARVVRKGGTERTQALSLYAGGGARGALVSLGPALGPVVGVRLDRPALSAELRLSLGFASTDNERHTIETRELLATALAARAFDVGRFTLGLGLEAGAGWLAQHFVDPEAQPDSIPPTPARDSAAFLFGPVAQCDLALAGRVYARLELAAPTYLARVGDDANGGALEAHVTWGAAAGAGFFF